MLQKSRISESVFANSQFVQLLDSCFPSFLLAVMDLAEQPQHPFPNRLFGPQKDRQTHSHSKDKGRQNCQGNSVSPVAGISNYVSKKSHGIVPKGSTIDPAATRVRAVHTSRSNGMYRWYRLKCRVNFFRLC